MQVLYPFSQVFNIIEKLNTNCYIIIEYIVCNYIFQPLSIILLAMALEEKNRISLLYFTER